MHAWIVHRFALSDWRRARWYFHSPQARAFRPAPGHIHLRAGAPTVSICCALRSTFPGAGVDEGGQPARGAVLLGAAGHDLVGQPGRRCRWRRRPGRMDATLSPRPRVACRPTAAAPAAALPTVGVTDSVGPSRASGCGPARRRRGAWWTTRSPPITGSPRVAPGHPHVAGAVAVDERAGHGERLPVTGVHGAAAGGDRRQCGAGQVTAGRRRGESRHWRPPWCRRRVLPRAARSRRLLLSCVRAWACGALSERVAGGTSRPAPSLADLAVAGTSARGSGFCVAEGCSPAAQPCSARACRAAARHALALHG